MPKISSKVCPTFTCGVFFTLVFNPYLKSDLTIKGVMLAHQCTHLKSILGPQLSQNERPPFSVVSFCSLFYFNKKPITQIKNFVLGLPPLQ